MDSNLSKIVGNNIKLLLEKREVMQKDLAAFLGVKDNVISYFVSGTRLPNTEQILKIADFFKTSTDFLLGYSDADTINKDIKFICDYIHLSNMAVEKLHNYLCNFPCDFESGYEEAERKLIMSIINDRIVCNQSYYEAEYIKKLLKLKYRLKEIEIEYSDKENIERIFSENKIEDHIDMTLFRLNKICNFFVDDYTSNADNISKVESIVKALE